VGVSRERSESPLPSRLTSRPRDEGDETATVRQLCDGSSSRGFGAGVFSWDGTESLVNKEVQKDQYYEREEGRLHEYDEDFDRGKVKKVKYKDEEQDKWNHSNQFQTVGEMKMADKQAGNYYGRNESYNRNRRYSYPPQRGGRGYQNREQGGYRTWRDEDNYRDSRFQYDRKRHTYTSGY